MKKRSEADMNHTWKLEDMMPDNQTWEALFEKTAARVKQYGEFRGTLAESADALYRCLKFDDGISLDIERLYVYARMRSDEDTAEQTYQDMFGRVQSLSFEAAERSSFIVPEILEMDPALLASYMESENGIGLYRRLMERILGKREHTLSGPMEELLAQSYDATQGASQIFNMFNNADVKFPSITGENGQEVPITHGNYISLMEHKDRRIRRDAFLGLYSVYRRFQPPALPGGERGAGAGLRQPGGRSPEEPASAAPLRQGAQGDPGPERHPHVRPVRAHGGGI